MKIGDRIKVPEFMWSTLVGYETHTIEEFRHCLGVFESAAHREAGDFTPLCELYYDGPGTEIKYISNFGEYRTNQVQAWIDLPN